MPTSQAEQAPLWGKPQTPALHVPAKIPPQHLSARRKAIIRWMLFLKALDSEPAINFQIT